ncbi:allergen Tyr p 13-like protein [Dinothrombium tinctorium]|uniref:Allergen Tyr p 13-like protein n=1 Tax=Dinothrombium tinctorium TaxID=1965070 RepID=A0A3S3PBS8_9ACAR|nr:allergen Tyr p 13-like protein [Dinothrombium tinctorium]RWS12100.1 allergen Tyr p 13-like protein [Dinothrombium tinctorium]
MASDSPDLALGKFELVKSEKFDEFLRELGVNFIMRKLAQTATPTIHVTKDGDTYCIKTTTTFKTTELKFKLDEEFEETRMDGVVVKTKVTREGDKFIQKQSGDKPCEIIREFSEDELKTVSENFSFNYVSMIAQQTDMHMWRCDIREDIPTQKVNLNDRAAATEHNILDLPFSK